MEKLRNTSCRIQDVRHFSLLGPGGDCLVNSENINAMATKRRGQKVVKSFFLSGLQHKLMTSFDVRITLCSEIAQSE